MSGPLVAHLARATLGNSVWVRGQLVTFLAIGADTAGQFALLRVHARRGAEPGWHYHTGEDETVYVLRGALTVLCAGGAGGDGPRALCARPGESVTIPRDLAHTARYDTAEVTFLLHFSPAGFERYLHTISAPAEYLGLPPPTAAPPPPDDDRLAALAARYGCVFLGPRPKP
ncbi:MAG TPA: cupin domain-containing protein [Thermomicrobiales bacterium]|nr:cupin domain-containing protein [Thermomicrobiales bacterium]